MTKTEGQNGLILTSYKETQIVNGLNTGNGSPSSEVVKIFSVSNMPSLGRGLGPPGSCC